MVPIQPFAIIWNITNNFQLLNKTFFLGLLTQVMLMSVLRVIDNKNNNQLFIINHKIIEAKIHWKQNDLKINK